MVVVVVDVVMVDVVVVLGAVVGDGEIVVPENQRVILVDWKGCKKRILKGVMELLTIYTNRAFCNHHRSSDNLFAFEGLRHIDLHCLDIDKTHPRML